MADFISNRTGQQMNDALKQMNDRMPEQWTTGQIDGVDVPESNPRYHNNAKYYAEQAGTEVEQVTGMTVSAESLVSGEEATVTKTGGGTEPVNLHFGIPRGENGATVSAIAYQSGTSPTTVPTGTWQTSPVVVTQGNYLWTRISFSDGTYSYSVARQGINGYSPSASVEKTGSTATITITDEDGTTTATVEDGATVDSVDYQSGDSPTNIPTGEWQDTPVVVLQGNYLWTRTAYTDGTYSYSVARQGVDGDGAGDMRKADYDADNTIETAGGIKAFVNSSVATNTAYFRGTYDLVDDLGLQYGASKAEIAAALLNAITTVTNNDYVFTIDVLDGNEFYERFKFSTATNTWAFEYELNNSSFTAQQWAAISSGITSAKVSSYDTHIADATIHVTNTEKNTWNNKENTSNKVTSISSRSTDTQYPSAKCVYNIIGDVESLLAAI